MINEIYLSWRKGVSASRHLVGLLKREQGKISFRYINNNLPAAQAEGFRWYPEFPDIMKTYTENVIEILSIRLIPNDRADRAEFLRFWEADDADLSAFEILALTQGKLPTDNFEFLGNFYFKKNFTFVTDVARLSYTQPSSSELFVGDQLTYQYDDTNTFDSDAVRVLKGRTEIGHIKKVHNFFFRHANGKKIDLTIKAIGKNGVVKNIYLLVKT